VSIFGDRSIALVEGHDWFTKRRAFNPGFDQDIDAGEAVHMLNRSQTFTSDVIVQAAYGEDWGGSDQHPPRLWMTELTELTALRGSNPVAKYFGFRTDRRIKHLEKLFDKEFYRILDRRLAEASAGTASKTRDICSIAIDQMKCADGSLTDDDRITVMHQLKTFYFAGHDTTATLISWAVWLLSQHDDALEKLRAELKEQDIWADGKTPTYDQLQNCPYLEVVLTESLRLSPPAATAQYTYDLS
jgi:cytochrome P450